MVRRVFTSTFLVAVAVVALASRAFAATISRVSEAVDGTGGSLGAGMLSVSDDGRGVAFRSVAPGASPTCHWYANALSASSTHSIESNCDRHLPSADAQHLHEWPQLDGNRRRYLRSRCRQAPSPCFPGPPLARVAFGDQATYPQPHSSHQECWSDLDAAFGIGPDSAAEMLVTAGDNTDRVRSEAALARLCGACPIPAGSGKTNGRHRPNRGGNGQANAALYRMIVIRMRWHLPTIDDVARRTAEGLSSKEIIRCLKRFLVCEISHPLPEPSTPTHVASAA